MEMVTHHWPFQKTWNQAFFVVLYEGQPWTFIRICNNDLHCKLAWRDISKSGTWAQKAMYVLVVLGIAEEKLN